MIQSSMTSKLLHSTARTQVSKLDGSKLELLETDMTPSSTSMTHTRTLQLSQRCVTDF